MWFCYLHELCCFVISDSGTMDRICAFCCRGEKSLLGQGELTRNDPTVGFNPFRKQLAGRNKRALSDATDDTSLSGTGRRGSITGASARVKNKALAAKNARCDNFLRFG